LGNINHGELTLNDAGQMVEKWYYELENKFSDLQCHAMVVMPNHFHCIIENIGANLRVCPNDDNLQSSADGQSHRIAPTVGGGTYWANCSYTRPYLKVMRGE